MVHVFTAKHVLKCFAESEILSVTLDLCLNLFTSKMSLMVTSSDTMRCKQNTEWLEFLSQTAKPKCPIYYILLCFTINKPVVDLSSWSHPDISDIISNPLCLLFPIGLLFLSSLFLSKQPSLAFGCVFRHVGMCVYLYLTLLSSSDLELQLLLNKLGLCI